MVANFMKHLTVGFCTWDIPGLILLIAAIAFVVIRKISLKKELKELEEGK